MMERSTMPVAIRHSIIPFSSPASGSSKRDDGQRDLLPPSRVFLRDFGISPRDLLPQQRVVENVAARGLGRGLLQRHHEADRKSTRLNSSHMSISYAVFCLKKK